MSKFINFCKHFKNKFLDMLYPKHIKCIFCDSEIDELNYFDSCENCLTSDEFIKENFCIRCGLPRTDNASGVCLYCKKENSNFDLARAIFRYEGKVQNLIHKFKYNNAKYLAEPIAYYMYELFKTLNWNIDLIGFVPMNKDKQKLRGYNQAELIANELSKLTNITCKNLFERVKDVTSQTKLTRQQRRENIKDAFKLIDRKVKGLNILIVDDVFTTGATVNELSKLLKNAKVKSVYIITLAHSVLKENF